MKSDKKMSSSSIQYSNKIFIEDQNNPAFNYLKKEYSININNYSTIADIINEASLASALELEEIYSVRANDHLVHFFYDLYLVLSSSLFASNSDWPAIVDGMHLKYFGQPSQEITTIQIDVWAKKEKCYLNSCFKILKQKDFPRSLATLAFYCISDENLSATECLKLSKILVSIMKIVLPKLENKIKSNL